MVLAFCLADRMAGDSGSKVPKIALRMIGAGGAILFATAWIWYYGKGIDDRWAGQLAQSGNRCSLGGGRRFCCARDQTERQGRNICIQPGQLALTAGRKLDMRGTGMMETLLWPEAKLTMQALLDHGPADLFIDPRVHNSNIGYPLVFAAYENGIRANYVTREWAPNGRLLHMVRSRGAADHDQVPYQRPLQVSGGRDDFPLMVTNVLSQTAFHLDMKVVADPRQAGLAVLASFTDTDSGPFQGMVIYHQRQYGSHRLGPRHGQWFGLEGHVPIRDSRPAAPQPWRYPIAHPSSISRWTARPYSIRTISPSWRRPCSRSMPATGSLNVSPRQCDGSAERREIPIAELPKSQDRRFNGEIIRDRAVRNQASVGGRVRSGAGGFRTQWVQKPLCMLSLRTQEGGSDWYIRPRR